jgi:sialidase-1
LVLLGPGAAQAEVTPVASVPVSAAASVAVSATKECSSTPLRSVPAKHRWFRIPAIVATNAGTLVAFAESRDNNDASDTGNYDVVTTRSTDHGCSWSPVTVVGNDAANRISTPVPIVDRTTGKILLFSVDTVRANSGGQGHGLYLQTSSDDGKTFSPLLSDPIRPDGQYKGGLSGPGHGIQLSVTNPGRLLLALGYRAASGLYGAYGIYSDDHGATWHTGYDQQDTTGKVDFMEGTIAELSTGKLFISYRLKHDSAKAGTARVYASSDDGGASLSGKFIPLPLKIVSVQGSSLVPTGAHNNELLFSAPADPTPNLRRDMSIFVSTTGGSSWQTKYQVQLESTPGSYSDLVQPDANSVGVLYETGIATWKERIAYQAMSIPALTHPVLVTAKVGFYRSAHPTKPTVNAKLQAKVTVPGISSPPGRVTLTAVGAGRSRSAAIDLTYSNHGVRWIVLPKLPKGRYHLSLSYSGTNRIQQRTTSAGTLSIQS